MRSSDWSSDVCSSDLPGPGCAVLARATDLLQRHKGLNVARKQPAGTIPRGPGAVPSSLQTRAPARTRREAMTQNRKPVALAIGATLAGGLMLSGSAFASTPLAQGYLLGAQEAGTADKAKEGSCGRSEEHTSEP